MSSSFIIHPSSLASLWLHESPDLRPAYTHLFLLNVFPYGDVFTSRTAELNGSGAELAAQAYAAHHFDPPELNEVAAPDHLGLQLAFLDYLAERNQPLARSAAYAGLITWAPAACLAVLREPGIHAFYTELARATLDALLADNLLRTAALPSLPAVEPGPLPDPTGDVRLRDLVAFFLAPARCGLWLSRGRLGELGQRLGLPLPFGPRSDVAEALFAAAGSTGKLEALLRALGDELSAWDAGYSQQPPDLAWPLNERWQARLAEARGQLMEMRLGLRAGEAK